MKAETVTLTKQLTTIKGLPQKAAENLATFAVNVRAAGVEFTDYDAYAFARGLVAERIYETKVTDTKFPNMTGVVNRAFKQTLAPFFDLNDLITIADEFEKQIGIKISQK